MNPFPGYGMLVWQPWPSYPPPAPPPPGPPPWQYAAHYPYPPTTLVEPPRAPPPPPNTTVEAFRAPPPPVSALGEAGHVQRHPDATVAALTGEPDSTPGLEQITVEIPASMSFRDFIGAMVSADASLTLDDDSDDTSDEGSSTYSDSSASLWGGGVSLRVLRMHSRMFFARKCPADAMCAICQDRISPGAVVRELACQHIFHIGCVDRALETSDSCPLCRQDIDAATSAPVFDRMPEGWQ